MSLRLRQTISAGHYAQFAAIDGVPGDPDNTGRTVIRLGRGDGALLVAEFGWQERDSGVYAVAQGVLLDRGAGRTTGFVRAGAANRHVNVIDLAFDAGVLVERPLGEHGPSAFTAGVAVARFGRAQRATQASLGAASAANEATLEIGARWQPLPSLALQPRAGLASALVTDVTLRTPP